MTWSTGDVVFRRGVWRGRPWYVGPKIVVQDRDDLLVTYAPHGAGVLLPAELGRKLIEDLAAETWELRPTTRYNHTLFLNPSGAAHSIFLFWSKDWELISWYINMEAPYSRRPDGFDTCDYQLDVVVSADLSEWHWKDEDHMEFAIDLGLISKTNAEEIRAEGERVIEDLEKRRPPFCDGWETWRPDPAWPLPRLPKDWQSLT